MKLHVRRAGETGSPTLVILHGLLGSSRNWTSVARRLSERFHVLSVDLRNHGESPHAAEMGFATMAQDLVQLLDAEGLKSAHFLGHSLGGKVAMRFAMDHPQLMLSLIVADIAPRDYGLHFLDDFKAMLALDLGHLENRKQADDALADAVPDWAHRQFLLTNLKRDKAGEYVWAANIESLANGLATIRKSPLANGEHYDGPALFLYGMSSDFVLPGDHAGIKAHFPNAQIQGISEAGHNLHVDNSEDFNAALYRFYGNL